MNSGVFYDQKSEYKSKTMQSILWAIPSIFSGNMSSLKWILMIMF